MVREEERGFGMYLINPTFCEKVGFGTNSRVRNNLLREIRIRLDLWLAGRDLNLNGVTSIDLGTLSTVCLP